MARIVNSIWSLRSADRINTRLALRDERTYATRLLPWLALAMVAFAVVDWLSVKDSKLIYFLAIRGFAVLLSRVVYLLSRGRTRYGTRLFLTVAPYILAVEYIMISNDLWHGPYFAGLCLVMITSTMLFPVPKVIAGSVYTISSLPIFLWFSQHTDVTSIDVVTLLLMLIGSIVICSLNSGQVWTDHKERLKTAQQLAIDLGQREKEIKRKADELLKYRAFESQFSPQVVADVMKDQTALHLMRQVNIAVIVIDIENSTEKSGTLLPLDYKTVIEEVFDVFASACLKWNVTIDKFTGDGAQAFAGAPVDHRDSLIRGVRATLDAIRMLQNRLAGLESTWGGALNIRFAICEGTSLVGFLGRGTLKSYTALGQTVSLTHRLCAVTDPWTITVGSQNQAHIVLPSFDKCRIESAEHTDLKGFGKKRFQVQNVSIHDYEKVKMLDRCKECGTPLVFEETLQGLPKIICPGCASRNPKVVSSRSAA